MITITIQEFRNPHGKGWLFRLNHTGSIVAEVDRRKNQRDYEIFYEHAKVGKRSNREPAIEEAKRMIRDHFCGSDVKFRQSVVVWVEK